MMESGYGALTARNVAEKVGLKHQLVYYYFHTMDDLMLTAFRRRAAQELARVQQALASDRPLQAFWDVQAEPSRAALTIEYMALANHNEAIRAETVEFGERLRLVGLSEIGARVHRSDVGGAAIDPLALIIMLNSVGAILGMEGSLGISGGHEQTRALVGRMLDWLGTDR